MIWNNIVNKCLEKQPCKVAVRLCVAPKWTEKIKLHRCFLYNCQSLSRVAQYALESATPVDSRPPCCPVRTLGKLFTLLCLCHQAVFGTRVKAGDVTVGYGRGGLQSIPPGAGPLMAQDQAVKRRRAPLLGVAQFVCANMPTSQVSLPFLINMKPNMGHVPLDFQQFYFFHFTC